MVTSLGIIMGFLLNFLASWAVREDPAAAVDVGAERIVLAAILPSLLLMVIVLYRILDFRKPPEQLAASYLTTLRLYMVAIILAFLGVGLALFF